MEIKLFTILDRMTEIKAMGVEMISDNPIESAILRSAGYGRDIVCIQLCQLSQGGSTYDPYRWEDSRTMGIAHKYIIDNWSKLTSGDVIDVEVISGEKHND